MEDFLLVLFFVFIVFIVPAIVYSSIDAKKSEERRRERLKQREEELEQRIKELEELSESQKSQNEKTNFYGRRDYSDNYYGELKGKCAESITALTFESLIKNDGAHIINNIRLPLYERTCEIDHLVIGKFGVLVVETKGRSGVIYGNGKKLTQEIGPYTYEFYNPLYQNETQTKNVAYHLRKGKFRNVSVYGVVVFTSEDVEFPEELGIRVEELPDFYNNLRKTNCNTEKIFEYFKSICVSCSSIM